MGLNGCLFLDVEESRLIGGYIPESGIPKAEFVKLKAAQENPEEELCAEAIKLLTYLKTQYKTKDVILLLGAGDIKFSYLKEIALFNKPSRISGKLLQDMRINALKRASDGGEYMFICDIVKGIDIDGAKYIGIPSDKQLKGKNVAMELFVAIAKSEKVNLIKSCIKRAKCRLINTLSREIVVGQESINTRQKHNGAIFMHIGTGKTSAVFYYQGIIQKISVYPYGSKDITSALMKEFGLPFSVAQFVQDKYVDTNILSKASSDEEVSFLKNNKKYSAKISDLCRVIDTGIKNICSGIKSDIMTWDYPLNQCKIYISGAITLLDGFLETAEFIFSMPVELAYCKNQSCIDVAAGLMPFAIIPGALWKGLSCRSLPQKSLKEKIWMIWNDLWNLF